tara:strand:- start:1931 stop:2797 length:867 start_codon:yes stop_codon:yes gene_type:complete
MKSVIFIIISCFFFSILAALIKYNSTYIHPVEQAFFRNFISIFFLFPLLLKKNLWSPQKKNFKLLFLRGFLGGITMILLFCSYSLIPLSQAMAISFSTPIFIYIGGALFFNEKTSKSMNFFTLFGFILTLIIIRPDLEIKLGIVFAIGAAITHAMAGLLVKKLSESENIFTLMFSMVLLMTPITFIPTFYVWTTPTSSIIIISLILVALTATIGNYFWTKSISLSELTNIMPFDFTKLLFSTLIGLFFFGEKIDKLTIICGSLLILCNTLMAQTIKSNKNEKSNISNN